MRLKHLLVILQMQLKRQYQTGLTILKHQFKMDLTQLKTLLIQYGILLNLFLHWF